MYVLLIVVCPFVPFLLAIVFSALLRHTDSDIAAGSDVLVIPYSNVYCETIFSMGKKVQTDNKSQLGKNTKEGRAADNVYLGETNVSVGLLCHILHNTGTSIS